MKPVSRPIPAAGGGEIDFRLARQSVLGAFRSGSLTQAQICDAQPELLRNAEFCGAPTDQPCPICEAPLRHVTYVFGSRLPSHGRCISAAAELERLAQRRATSTGYIVEVCVTCRWNHLVRSYLMGTG